jgi:hypothetical protein
MQQTGPTIAPPFQEEQPPPAPDWLRPVFDPTRLHPRQINYVRVEPQVPGTVRYEGKYVTDEPDTQPQTFRVSVSAPLEPGGGEPAELQPFLRRPVAFYAAAPDPTAPPTQDELDLPDEGDYWVACWITADPPGIEVEMELVNAGDLEGTRGLIAVFLIDPVPITGTAKPHKYKAASSNTCAASARASKGTVRLSVPIGRPVDTVDRRWTRWLKSKTTATVDGLDLTNTYDIAGGWKRVP